MLAGHSGLGCRMSSDSSWSALPADILQRAFELQPEGLALCGATSSCTAWRSVARHSRVNNLHLHSATDGQEQFWPHLLLARTCIDTLKLTSQRTLDLTRQTAAINRSEGVAKATINSIPTACRSLFLSEFCAYGLEQYIAKSPEVQQLSLQWNGLRAGHSSFHPLPSFSALHQLTQLTVHMRNDSNGRSFPSLVKSCPDTVESLILEGFGLPEEDVGTVSSLTILESTLPVLTRLKIARSVVRVSGGDITCLSKLKSLSLCHLEIYVGGQLEVTLLTNLTHLDLTGAKCYWEDPLVDAFETFTAWPSLAVLKIYDCNVFDISTVMDVSTVKEVHAGHFDHFAQPRPDQESHVRTHCDFVPSYDGMRAATVVDLTIDANTDPFLDSVLGCVAAHFSLRSLTLHTESGCAITKPLDFSGAGFSDLRHLAVANFDPSVPSVDLQSMSCLTSLKLSTDALQPSSLKSLLLPSKLEVLIYIGYDLFLSGVKHNLHELPSLTKVELQIGFAGCRSVCLPQLPLSLQHLVVIGKDWCRRDCDWSGLHGCPELKHLTLAMGQRVFGQLKLWVKSARCLYVVDQTANRRDQLKALSGGPATRLPQVFVL